jgi:ribose transport system permease protein
MFVIVTGGIDLSVGSLICLNACVLQWLLIQQGVPPITGLLIILLLSMVIGLCHGLLITKVSLQPFVVTLCGLLLYRGLARWMTGDQNVGWGSTIPELREVATYGISFPGTTFVLPWPFVVMIVIAILSALFLHKTIYGRYLLALGRNEQAARYSGINTSRMVVVAYVLCSVISAIGGTIMALYQSLIQPTAIGTFYELYAIAACVLGRCSLRGGQGYVFGVIMGAALLPLIRNSISFLGIGDQLEFGVIGVVILIGVVFDELVRTVAVMRREGVSVTKWIGKKFTSRDTWNGARKVVTATCAILVVLSLIAVADSARSLNAFKNIESTNAALANTALANYHSQPEKAAGETDTFAADYKKARLGLGADQRQLKKDRSELKTAQSKLSRSTDLEAAQRAAEQTKLDATVAELDSTESNLDDQAEKFEGLKEVFGEWEKSHEKFEFKTEKHPKIKSFAFWTGLPCGILFALSLGYSFLGKRKQEP